ncbi:leucine-rich repeat protein [Anaerofustis stercorihominis]|uniref:leucine-rich repeat protein n=1 Tax=Anaerofustis stercorihominis TaxID=214853 RepID=UPI00214B8EE5|nr:leucine-rich repeat protein [Anaerofustis stercorihominis]MCR2033169.1 leucine-rich repeat protein [Anaerofustis stercorihominis]
MKKKLILLLLMIFSILSISTFAFAAESGEDVSSPEDFTYVENDDGTVGINEYHGTSLNVVIPDTYHGKNVTIVAQDTFLNKKDIESVVWSNNVDCVDGYIFKDCKKLTKVVLTSSVKTINVGAFQNCTSLTDITIPEGLTDIGQRAFYMCNNLDNVILPNTVSSIGDEAFTACWELKNITLSYNLKFIGESAFSNCRSINSLTLPDGLEELGKKAFYNSSNLREINIPVHLITLGENAFMYTDLQNLIVPSDCANFSKDNSILFSKDKTNLILVLNDAQLGDYQVPESVRVISPRAFAGNTSLTSIKIPQTVTSIGFYCFTDCTNLVSADFLGASVEIPQGAFDGCSKLTDIKSSEGISSIGMNAFTDCISLKGIDLGDNLKKIGLKAFENCIGMDEFIIPKNVTSIEHNIFTTVKEGFKLYNNSSESMVLNNPIELYSLFDLTVDNPENGDYEVKGNIIEHNGNKYIKSADEVTVSVTPKASFIPVMKYNNTRVDSPYTFVMPNNAVSLSIAFNECSEHDFNDLEIVREATCTEEGEKRVICKICEGTFNIAIPALGHDYSTEFTIDKDPTCTVPGEKSKHCKRCDAKSEITEVSVIAHDYSSEFIVDKEPTCTDEGEKSKYCTRCDERGEITSVPALGHDYSADFKIDKEPTCTLKGEKSKYCIRCDERSKITPVPALGHEYSKEYTTDKEATCVEEGLKSRHCIRCDAFTDQVKITATGNHKYDSGVITTPATCTKKGEKTYTCSVCKRTKTEEIGKTPHDYAKYKVIKPTCTSEGYTQYKCKDCGDINYDDYTDMIDHDYIYQGIYDYPTCTMEGSNLFECSQCGKLGYTVIKPLGHKYVLFTTIKPTIYQEGFGTYICANDARHRYDYVIPKLKGVSLVRLNSSGKTMVMGGSYYLKASVYPANASNRSVSWKSSNTKVATVNASGKVYFKSPGKAYIYATAKDGSRKSAKATVKVLPKKVSKIKLKAGKKKVTISIAKTGGAKHYEIYRSTKKNKGFKKIKKTASRKYVNKKLKSKKVYYYKVRAVYGSYKGSYSKVYKVKVK